jgi:hypothetical protein
VEYTSTDVIHLCDLDLVIIILANWSELQLQRHWDVRLDFFKNVSSPPQSFRLMSQWVKKAEL